MRRFANYYSIPEPDNKIPGTLLYPA